MKIAQSSIAMQGRSEHAISHTRTESLRIWKGQAAGAQQAQPGARLSGDIRLALSAAGYAKLREDLARSSAAAQETGAAEAVGNETAPQLTDKELAKIKLIEDFVYVLTGKRIKINIPEQVDPKAAQQIQQKAVQTDAGPRRLGWGMSYQFHERIHETESVQFAASGDVTTADGRRISFDLGFAMSREFLRQTDLSITAGDAMVDPLVLNFNGAAATLGERSFRFDLDVDGTMDTIAFTSPGSGFLALDHNGNGQIDDGSELFGPQSGNGFSELAVHDDDGNGWIDENDPVFDKLRIWPMNEAGEVTLEAIGQAGVGAIYLGNVQTPYRLMGQDGLTNGQIARSGVYLKESGEAAPIQHVDLQL
jgi:hypothetical protein